MRSHLNTKMGTSPQPLVAKPHAMAALHFALFAPHARTLNGFSNSVFGGADGNNEAGPLVLTHLAARSLRRIAFPAET